MIKIREILIANRAEIAVRVIRACRDLYIKSVAIFTEPDRECLHVKVADKAYRIGTDAIRGYLDIAGITEIAKACGADAIHPDHGLLSENYEIARVCKEVNIIFIGPKSEVIYKMGNKNITRNLVAKNGIPVVLGTEKLNDLSLAQLKEQAERIGYPVILKASGGSGGRGIRVVHQEEELKNVFESCRREVLAYFNNDEVFMKKYTVNPRHIEFQVLGDNYGNIIHPCERNCSIQRRHQKVVEVAPCPGISENLHKTIGVTVVAAAKAMSYTDVGTIEFLLNDYNRFYFMEVNTGIQVEHPVTEEVTDMDLIVRQIRIADGEILDLEQSDIKPRGFAIEMRVTAENVWENFIPSPSKIGEYYPVLGPSVRVDSHIYKDYVVPPFYDSMLAKLITKVTSCDLVINKLERTLKEFMIDGIRTTVPFLITIIKTRGSRRGYFDTSFIETHLDELLANTEDKHQDNKGEVVTAIVATLKKIRESRK